METEGANFELTMKCNLNCRMCCQKDARKDYNKEMELGDVKNVISNLNGIERVYFVGGETLLRKDIFDIFNILDKKGIKYEISSNGSFITNEFVEKLKKLRGLKKINLSLDGLKKTHNKIRNSKKNFDEVINAIKITRDYFNLEIVSVIMKENLKELTKMLIFLSSLGVKNVRFVIEMFSTSKEREETTKILGRDIEIRGQLKKSSGYDYKSLKNAVENIIATSKKINMSANFEPKILLANMEKINNRKIRDLSLDCRQLKQARIDPEGNLIICEFIRDSFGSLINSNIEELWNSEKYKLTKKKILDNNLLPICNNCCKLIIK